MQAQQEISAGSTDDPSSQKERLRSRLDYGYHELIEDLPAAIYTCDPDGRITFYNEAAALLWGRRPELGKDLWCGSWKIYNTDGTLLPLDECPMAIALKEKRAVKAGEIVVERPDGDRVHVVPHPKPLFSPDGKMTGAITMLVDITEKKDREQSLRESEKKYRLLSGSLEKMVEERTSMLKESEERYHRMIDEVQDYAIILLSKEGIILNWNKGAEKIKGYRENEIIGKNFKIFYQKEDQQAKLPESLIAKATENGRAMHEGWRVRKDGTRFWGSIVITALHDEQHHVIGFTKVTRDLTEKKHIEDQMNQYARELEFRNNELEQFVYVASHDLREPLRKMQIFTELLKKNIDDPSAIEKNLEKISSSAKRMAALISDALQYAQLNRTDQFFAKADLNEIIQNVKEDFELLIEGKNAVINSSHLPAVRGIPAQLHQLFSNLLSNSLKFTDTNPVITINSEEVTKDDAKKLPRLDSSRDYLVITFKDNGVGFEPQYAEQVFKVFRRLDEKREGSGIGLALCKKIMENHNGHISASSEPGKGTTFNIYLPCWPKGRYQ